MSTLPASSALWRTAGYRPRRPAVRGAGIRGRDGSRSLVALSPPLDEWSEQWLAAHMVQHELLMVVAAPLIAVGAPLVAMLWAMPVAASATRSSVRPAHAAARHLADDHRAGRRRSFSMASRLWIWHIPALYDAALEHEAVHVVQHLCFFGTAALFWWGIVHGRQGRLGYGAAVVYVFVTAVHGGVLGALLTVSPRVWYAPYLAHHPAGLTPLEDQQLAGLLMWMPAGLAFVAGALFLFAGVAATVRPAVTFSIAAARAAYGYPMSTRSFLAGVALALLCGLGAGCRRQSDLPGGGRGPQHTSRSWRRADDSSRLRGLHAASGGCRPATTATSATARSTPSRRRTS